METEKFCKVTIGTEYAHIPIDEYKRLLELSLRVRIMKEFVKAKDRDYLNKSDLKWMFDFVDEEAGGEDV